MSGIAEQQSPPEFLSATAAMSQGQVGFQTAPPLSTEGAVGPVSTTSGQALKVKRGGVVVVSPGDYDPAVSHYPRVVNAAVHPTVAQFFSLTRSQMVVRYCSLHPEVSAATLNSVLRHVPKHFKWAGCDLFVCGPRRRTVVVETNSCPSGQKSLPFRDGDEHNGYGRLMRTAFRSLLPQAVAEAGGAAGGAAAGEGSVYAVIYDKNEMEARGYAGALADITGEPVHLAEFYLTDPDPPLRWSAGGHLSVRTPTGAWLPVKAALRYVTQKPWTRMPVVPATPLLNPLLPCLAGGRNKMLAARAYSALNDRLAAASTPLRLLTPHTLGDISKERVPELVAAMGGCAVVKVPYGNAGQGVYTITCASELAAFMAETHGYDKFIVQQLVGGRLWGAGGSAEGSSSAAAAAAAVEKAYHLGTVPSTKGHTYVFDLRMMVCADEGGFKPCSMYARRAAAPLGERSPGEMEGAGGEQGGAAAAAAAGEAGSKGSRSHCSSIGSVAEAGAAGGGSAPAAAAAAAASGKSASASWQQLGTNLSVLTGDLTWSTESERLVMMDARDFQVLGLGLDDLIDAFVQSCLAVTAIDDQAQSLLTPDGQFNLQAFEAVNDDPALIRELYVAPP